ncbi:TIGR01244 family sulfur transferase [Paraburkholderia silvatlantica]|uniref:TIGR01244 family sulfur transferase n=1 Tax=Paraburkholderia silvatlantica TaxID=321895 RepID=UPI0037527E18
MTVIKLTPDFAVSSQLSPADLENLRDAGFKAVICTRPDAEADDQPSFEAIGDAARNLGLEARHLPVQNGAIDDAQVAAFAEIFADLPKPVVGYCRTGNRAGMLWTMSASIRAALGG